MEESISIQEDENGGVDQSFREEERRMQKTQNSLLLKAVRMADEITFPNRMIWLREEMSVLE